MSQQRWTHNNHTSIIISRTRRFPQCASKNLWWWHIFPIITWIFGCSYHIYICFYTYTRTNRHIQRDKNEAIPHGVQPIWLLVQMYRYTFITSIQAVSQYIDFDAGRGAARCCFYILYVMLRYATQTNKSKKQNSHKSLNGKMFVQTFPFNS